MTHFGILIKFLCHIGTSWSSLHTKEISFITHTRHPMPAWCRSKTLWMPYIQRYTHRARRNS